MFDDTSPNPYDGTADNPAPEVPGMGGVMVEALRRFGLRLRVSLPCSIVAIHGNQLVDLQPLLKCRYKGTNTQAQPMPILTQALVAMPMGQNYSVRLPLKVGDLGLAIFCDRSLDAWATGDGSAVDPADARCHDLTDAVFYPGLVPVAKQTTDATDDLSLSAGQASLRMTQTGQFALSNGNQELLATVAQLAQTVQNLAQALVNARAIDPVSGPLPMSPDTIAQATSQATQAGKLAAQLATLKRS